jgi:hypothetical protein
MIKAEPSVLKAMVGLENNIDFQVLLDWLVRNLNEQEDINRIISTSNILLNQGQGRAQILHDIIKTLGIARQALKKSEAAKSPQQYPPASLSGRL